MGYFTTFLRHTVFVFDWLQFSRAFRGRVWIQDGGGHLKPLAVFRVKDQKLFTILTGLPDLQQWRNNG